MARKVSGWMITPDKCLLPVHLRYSLERPFAVWGFEIRTEQIRSLVTQPPPTLCGVAIYEQMGLCLPEDKGLLCAKWGTDLNRAVAWQRMQPLLLRPLGLCSGKPSVPAFEAGEQSQAIQQSDVKLGGAGLYLISLYWLSLTPFLMSRTKTIWYLSLEEHSYLTCFLSFTLLHYGLKATIHAGGWKLHGFPSLASFQVKPCRKLIIKKK